MSTRRDDLLDAAIALLAERGLHGVTHRAVDAAAEVPAGSTSNYFRTREALLVAIAERFAVRERDAMEQIMAELSPSTPDELAAALARSARMSAGPLRALTLARYAMLVESAANPAIRAELGAIGAGQGEHFQRWLKAAGSADPGRDISIISNHLTGLVLHQVALPAPDFDPLESLTALVRALMPHRRESRRKAPVRSGLSSERAPAMRVAIGRQDTFRDACGAEPAGSGRGAVRAGRAERGPE